MEESRSSFQEEMTFNDQTVYSYQQISCLDSVVRYGHVILKNGRLILGYSV